MRKLLLPAVALLIASVSFAEPIEIKGEKILKHPIGVLVMKSATLLKSGKVDDAIALRKKSEKADWENSAASVRKELGARMQELAPDPKAFEKALKSSGILTVREEEADLRADMGSSGTAVAYFALEGSTWRIITGPIVVGGAPDTSNEIRLEGEELARHPISTLVIQYVDLVHAGEIEKAMRLASTKAQADWKALPASEKKESMKFRKSILPKGNVLRSAVAGGILIIEADERATLNLVITEQKSSEPGVVQSSSSTIAIPFVLEDKVWKIAQ